VRKVGKLLKSLLIEPDDTLVDPIEPEPILRRRRVRNHRDVITHQAVACCNLRFLTRFDRGGRLIEMEEAAFSSSAREQANAQTNAVEAAAGPWHGRFCSGNRHIEQESSPIQSSS
jgi:hypothetical protein